MLPARINNDRLEAGCDEAGRGCLAGPVVAAAVILPTDYSHPLLNDSKQLSEKIRLKLVTEIEACAIAFSVSFIDNTIIDQINILNASHLAMHQSALKLDPKPEHLLIDGNRFKKDSAIEYSCIIKGDGKVASIAAASILAKTYRDDFMRRIHEQFPYYGWNKNMGYPTQTHRNAIADHGPCKFHRKSFQLLPSQYTLDFL